jgi:hypothetical protein
VEVFVGDEEKVAVLTTEILAPFCWKIPFDQGQPGSMPFLSGRQISTWSSTVLQIISRRFIKLKLCHSSTLSFNFPISHYVSRTQSAIQVLAAFLA